MKGRWALVAALAVGITLVSHVGCGRANHGTAGSIDLTIVVPPDVPVDALTFIVAGGAFSQPLVGGIETPRPQEVFEHLIEQIPEDDGYGIDVEATSLDGLTICRRSTTADVHRKAITRVHLTLQCAPKGGTISIAVHVACGTTHLVSYTVAPLAVSVGGAITLSMAPLTTDAGPLQYLWSAPSGTFADPTAAQTTYRCAVPGKIMLDLVVVASTCEDHQTIEVDCLGAGDAAPKDASTDASIDAIGSTF